MATNISIAYPAIPPKLNSPVWVQPAEMPELTYTPNLTDQAETAELLSRYYSLLSEGLRILALLEERGEA
jgi:hypothetical protein